MELRIIHHRAEKVEQVRADVEGDGHAAEISSSPKGSWTW
jgi:hypothetical protein